MANTATAMVDQLVADLPNKFGYPEFAGFAGEDLLHDIVGAVLPLSLLRTWEVFERKHAYDNDCFLSLGTVAKKARRSQRTVNRNIATFLARGLLVLRSEYKFFRRLDGSIYKKAVVVKDFSGLYALAHEYYEWQFSPDFLTPEYENLEHIQRDPRLLAKLCRFEDYRRLLEHHRDPFAQVQEDRRFTEYRADPPLQMDEEQVENAESNISDQNKTKILPKVLPNETPKVSQNESNEKAYRDTLQRDSFDSGRDLGNEGEASATSNVCSQKRASVAQGYTKPKVGQNLQNESEMNPVPPSHKNIPPGAGKTRESAENHSNVQHARSAMVAAGVGPGRSADQQAGELPPPKHPLARSFVHEVAGLFGDLNEKGSKTGIERRIEDFELDQPMDVLLCLVRAYVVARDTKDEKICRRRPDGRPNRMPLFCKMFERFAQALGPGSKWQYTYQQMFENIAADDRLSLWLSEHQAELASGNTNQAEEMETGKEQRREEVPDSAVLSGWAEWDVALAHGERLLQAIVDANYIGVGVALRERNGRCYVVYQEFADEKSEQVVDELVLSDETQIEELIRRAELGIL